MNEIHSLMASVMDLCRDVTDDSKDTILEVKKNNTYFDKIISED